ncbi:hypothetical protein B0A48_03961 [Cryoendolithus antarcticus]|uniref:Uncharacterized protein n=1 Tax=Cryoendolithus antarcticus TaxID=1507870 RepID=A0A1V8TGZ6_9PEZI|nr:hypothetical protein B0A48_03961 [Cryoendolithus antarcticus]
MASSTNTQDFWEILLNMHLALLTIAVIMAICIGIVRSTENKLRLKPIHRRRFGLIRLTFMFLGTDMLVWSQIMLRNGLGPKDEAWLSTKRTLEGCGLALGAMLVGQVVTGVGYLLVDRYKRRSRAAGDVEQQQEEAVVTEPMEERGIEAVDPTVCERCDRPVEKAEA